MDKRLGVTQRKRAGDTKVNLEWDPPCGHSSRDMSVKGKKS
jgi:hypothetical protein